MTNDWDQAYKQLNKSDPLPPDDDYTDSLFQLLVADAIVILLLLALITLTLRWALT